jgi:hypothetical protein
MQGHQKRESSSSEVWGTKFCDRQGKGKAVKPEKKNDYGRVTLGKALWL